MYILFTNSIGKCDIFFLLNLIIIIIIKNCLIHGFNPTHIQPMSSTRPNPTHVGWVGLDWTYVMSWVGLIFFYPLWWVRSKILLNLTHMHTPNLYNFLELTIWSRQKCIYYILYSLPLSLVLSSLCAHAFKLCYVMYLFLN